ncbi:lytic murein transglycosylase [Actibacterium atlanticum]|uniref:Lytic murein transglycosylase n=1 Tax=Actibacterium atlanticum TaxID=1461693 RepID=A0A058ZLZ0_9RHOB|nr:lytic murein transglycosylase [Actibacterium atlanticum]KCV82644.1 lytic murein transglycosylase [Actibacterium atlanticum]
MVKWVKALGLVTLMIPGVALAGMDSSPIPKPRPEGVQVARLASAVPPPRPTTGGAAVVETSTSNSAFQRWIDGFRGRALAKGISPRVFDTAFANIRYNTDVIAKDRHQSEYTKQIWDYLDSAASPTRVKNGQKALRDHGRTLEKIEAKYGVDKEVVAAVWGLESAYGEFKGDIPTIEALATLAFDGRRGKFFEAQLIDALKILQAGDVPVRKMKGSWAGAMGHTQFIPSSYLAYAVDFTGDGKRDIWSNNPTDALASTAAYLARHGWVTGQPWGVEVKLPKGFNYGLASRKIQKMPSDWGALGVRDMNGRTVRNYGAASILLPAGSQGAAFMIFKNFAVIERYNVADAYVIGVGHLADRIGGGPEIQASWPRGYAPLSFKQKKEMQRRLTRAGFLDDKIDGIIGPNTISAIREFQKSKGVTPDGYPSQELLKLLKS